MGIGDRFARWAQRFASVAPSAEVRIDLVGESPRRAVNRHRALYAQAGEFLFEHDLDITPLNFGLALDYLAGDPVVERAVGESLRIHGCLTNGIVEEIAAEREADKMTPEALAEMLDKVETHLDQVIQLTDHSRESAHDYGTELKRQADDLDSGTPSAPAIEKLVQLTRTMVETMRKAETQMRAHQKDARALQQNLEAARKAAEQDYLTGLPNRRAFESVLRSRAQAARDNGTPLAIAFCDLDHFKAINDTYGHDTGDRVLQFVARLLAEISRNACHVARHGGEEFAMLFEASTAEAAEIVDAAREDLAERNLVNREDGARLAPVSFSAGIADVLAYADGRAALKAADEALYLAKQQGRNRVYIAARPLADGA
ncbi:MAG: GGDEF domain-containing protein [Sphingomonas sp.]|nr:GGDEF domain-containing protein [Sphingomonas sp.]